MTVAGEVGTKTAYGLFHEGNTLIDRHQHPTPIDIDGPGLCELMLEGADEETAAAAIEEFFKANL